MNILKTLILILMLLLVCGCTGDDDDDSSADSEQVDDDSRLPGDDDDDFSNDDADNDADDDNVNDDVQENYPEVCENGPVFDFFLDYTPLTVPYPNDIYTVADATKSTGLRVQVDENTTRPIGLILGKIGFLDNAYNSLDGFSTVGDMYIPLSDEPDPDTLPDTFGPDVSDSLFLMVADTGSPHDGEFAPLIAEWAPRSIRLQTWKPLRQQTRYLLVATRKLKPREGRCYRASMDMHDIVENRHGRSNLVERYEPYIQMLENRGFDRGELLSISDFTTLCATCDLHEVRDILDERALQDPPVLTDWEITPNGNEAIDAYAEAKLDVPIFQDVDGVWTRDSNGDLIVQDHEQVNVLLSLPAADASVEGQPFPIVIYGHGAIDRKETLKSVAPFFAEKGFAMVGMNAVCHGDRSDGSGEVEIALCYFNFFKPLTWRDNIRQSASDHMWMIRALRNLGEVDEIPYETGGDGIPDFDVDHIYWFGHSLGTIHGGIISPFEENIDAWAMTMAGANYVWIGFYTYVVQPVVDVISAVEAIFPGIRAVDTVKLIGHMLQNILDAGEPANYLTHVIDDPFPGPDSINKQVMHIGAAFDETLGGFSGAYYCRAGGWPQLEPFVWDVGVEHAACPFQGSAFYQYNTDDHIMPFRSTEEGEAARRQMAHFFRTRLETGVGEIIDPFAPEQ